jgi:hypothetical protein
MRLILVVACVIALAGCSPVMHLDMRNESGRPVKIVTGSRSTTLAPGASVDLAPGRKFHVVSGEERWEYGPWLSGDFSSFNKGDDRYVRWGGWFGHSTVREVLQPDGRIFVLATNAGASTVAEPQPSGYPLTPVR